MANTVLRGVIKILGPLSDGTGNKIVTVNPTTGEVGQIDSLLSGVTGDISINGAGVSNINPGVIVNADINASAAIAYSKMAALATNRVMVTDGSGFATTSITTTVFNFIANLNSDAQIQLNGKENTIIGAASTIVGSNLAADKAVVSGAGGKIEAHPNTTLTEIGFVNGVTSPIQAQLNARLSVVLGAPSEGDIIYFDGSNWVNFARGTNGQVLTSSTTSIQWASASLSGIPTGGTADQYLRKIDGTDFNATWDTLTPAKFGTVSTVGEIDQLAGIGANVQAQLNAKLSNALISDNLWVGNGSGIATPTTDLPTGITIGGAVIYRVGGTDVTPADGGTGISSYTIGDILYASGGTTLSKLADVATGNALISGGPSWGKIGLTTHVSGTLPIANGGTNLTALGSALQVLRVNAGETGLEYATFSAGIGGSTGSVDNAALRSDGTGGSTLQPSDIIFSDTADITLGTNTLSGATRNINMAGSAPDVSISLRSKASGSVTSITGNGNTSIVTTSLLNILTSTNDPNSIRLFKSDTNTVQYALNLLYNCTGIPANGTGTGIQFETRTSTTNTEIGATIESITTDVTGTSENFDLIFKTMAAGAAASERLRLNGTGVKINNNLGVGMTASTVSRIQIQSGTTIIAPLQFNSGTVTTSPLDGAVEYDGTNYFVVSGTTRYTLAKTLTATASLNFPNTAASSTSDLTMTVTGAAIGDPVIVTPPNGSVAANSIFTCWVSATNTVTVRFSNLDILNAADPASGTYRAVVFKY